MREEIRPNDVVVCVDASSCPCGCEQRFLILGAYYRIVGLVEVGCEVGVLLQGQPLVFPHMGFYPHRFRKIEAPKTEISELIRACKPVLEPARTAYRRLVVGGE